MTDISPAFYVLRKATVSGMATAAHMPCVLCGTIISGMGGPGQNLCIKCGDEIMSGEMRESLRAQAQRIVELEADNARLRGDTVQRNFEEDSRTVHFRHFGE